MSSETITRNDLKAILDEVLPPQDGLLTTQSFEHTGLTVSAGVTTKANFSVAKSGYTPLGAVAWDSYDSLVTIASIINNGNGTFSMWVRNTSGSSITIKPRITVLYCKAQSVV